MTTESEESKPEVVHNAEARRFEVRLAGAIAVLNYHLDDKTITFTHTGVPREHEGRGVGGQIVRTGLDYARENDYRVRPQCGFVAAYVKRHPEYQPITEGY